MGMSRKPRAEPMLVGDIGATSTRLALAGRDGRLDRIEVFPTPDGDAQFLLRAYLDRHHDKPPRGCLLAVAGMVRGHGAKARVTLTNRATTVNTAALSRTLHCPVLLCNDLVALAAWLAYPVRGRKLAPLDDVTVSGAGTRIVVAVGTGFGAAIVTAAGEILPTESGHLQWPLDASVPETVEARLSGMALAARHPEFESATALAHAALAGSTRARSVVGEFTHLLGRACANLVLATGAWTGVYLSGGVIHALAEVLDGAALRAAFVSHPGFGAALARVPLVRIRDPHATLKGLAAQGAS